MIKLNRKWAVLPVLSALAMGAGLSLQVTAHAATYTTVSTTNLTKAAYQKKSTAGAIYNKAHNRKLATLKAYPNTTWYVTKKATLKHGNSKGIYYYVANKSNTVKGWIWHGYLQKGKAFSLKYAKNAVALDYKTGDVVWSKKANTPRPIASVAKLMTLYLVLQKVNGDASKWNQVVNTSSKGLIAMGKSNSCGGFQFKSGHKYTVADLYNAALLASSNNAAIALGQWVAGSNAKFIQQMNAQAQTWGMKKASFVSASGLENSDLKVFGYNYGSANANMVSAKDVALIAQHLIQDYPRILTDGAVGSQRIDSQLCYNYNNLLPGRKYYQAGLKVDGLKTGYTPLAGYCFVGTGQQAGKHRVITVVLHDENEFTETRSLMKQAYSYSSMTE